MSGCEVDIGGGGADIYSTRSNYPNILIAWMAHLIILFPS